MRKEKVFSFSQILFGLTTAILLFLFSQIGAFNGLYSGIATFFTDFRVNSYQFFNSLSENFNFFLNIDSVKKERDQLQQDKIVLTSENNKLKEQVQENTAIVKQLSFNLPFQLLPVRVLSYNENKAGEIFINKGSNSGLSNGSILVYENYAIGEVIETLGNSARVRLLTSADTLLPVITLEGNIKGVMTGDVADGLTVGEILIDKPIQTNDTFVTAGINSNFPYGLLVGKVSEVNGIKTDITKKAKLTNIINFNDLQELFVIVK